jgi:hypothetical protein
VGLLVGSEVAFFCLLLTGEKVTNEENEIEPVLKEKKIDLFKARQFQFGLVIAFMICSLLESGFSLAHVFPNILLLSLKENTKSTLIMKRIIKSD